jgi:hypothetical protein
MRKDALTALVSFLGAIAGVASFPGHSGAG